MFETDNKYWRRAVLAIVAAAAACFISGCGGMTNSMPAERFLSLSVSGLAGVDQFTFAGDSGILLPAGVTVGSVSYRGEVTDHANMTVQMTGSGDEQGGKGGIGMQSLQGSWRLKSKPGADSWLPKAALGAGSMKAKSASANNGAATSWSESTWAGLNPLERLERIKDAAKRVTYKEGENDGQRTVVIELEPSAAKQEWRDRIEAEWRAVAGDQLAASSAGSGKGRSAAYQQAGKLLAEMLDTLQAETVIEVTADRHSMLPLRVEERSTLHFQANGANRQEFHAGSVTFDGY